jgi:hypothetical protein
MPNEQQPSAHHKFEFVGGLFNEYVFAANPGLTYEIRFVPSGYAFARHPDFKDDVFEFIVRLLNPAAGNMLVPDPLVEATIIAIFQDFFARRGLVAIYVCDSSDNRQAARARLFDRWFENNRPSGFSKIDTKLRDPNGTIYLSLLVHQSYPHRDAVVTAFLRLIDDENTEKLNSPTQPDGGTGS